jgi:hypothetical protein
MIPQMESVQPVDALRLIHHNDISTRKEFLTLIRRALTDMASDGKIERASHGRPARWRLSSLD